MHKYLIIIGLVFVSSCSQKESFNGIVTQVKNSVQEIYPESSFELTHSEKSYHLKITGGNPSSEEIVKSKLSIPLFVMYQEVYNSSSVIDAETTFKVTQNIKDKSYQTATFNLFEMGEIQKNYDLITQFIADKKSKKETNQFYSTKDCPDYTFPFIQEGINWDLNPDQYILGVIKPITTNACNEKIKTTGFYLKNQEQTLWFLMDSDNKILVITTEL